MPIYSFHEFNKLSSVQAKKELHRCCGSDKWVELMMQSFPYKEEKELFVLVKDIWYQQCTHKDYLEAFAQHPEIGDKESLKKKFANTVEWASREQSGVSRASDETIEALTQCNSEYLQKNGFIYIVCATDKSASEMLNLLNERLTHSRDDEVNIARSEHFKISLIRMNKLIELSDSIWTQPSQITTHVLDTSKGLPGKGLCIRLNKRINENYQTMAIGVTNNDGRITDLLPPGVKIYSGHYQMSFDTGAYFATNNIKGFYPKVDIDFSTFDETHYHVPLLINPFGYSTYRGS